MELGLGPLSVDRMPLQQTRFGCSWRRPDDIIPSGIKGVGNFRRRTFGVGDGSRRSDVRFWNHATPPIRSWENG